MAVRAAAEGPGGDRGQVVFLINEPTKRLHQGIGVFDLVHEEIVESTADRMSYSGLIFQRNVAYGESKFEALDLLQLGHIFWINERLVFNRFKIRYAEDQNTKLKEANCGGWKLRPDGNFLESAIDGNNVLNRIVFDWEVYELVFMGDGYIFNGFRDVASGKKIFHSRVIDDLAVRGFASVFGRAAAAGIGHDAYSSDSTELGNRSTWTGTTKGFE